MDYESLYNVGRSLTKPESAVQRPDNAQLLLFSVPMRYVSCC